jgi:hypothetical protein
MVLKIVKIKILNPMKKYLLMMLSFVLVLPALKAQEEVAEDAFGRNNLSLLLSDVVMKRISFEYEHVFGDEGNMSINIPGSVAIAEADDVYGDEVQWWGGLGMKLYPTGQGKIRYFVGPEVRVISAKYNDQYVTYYEGWAENVTVDENYIHTAFLLNNGMIYEPAENFIFSVNLGLGFVARDQKTGDGIMPMATPSVRLGIRF